MALQTIDDASLVEVLFDVFRRYGYEGTTISKLSEVTGLKKSSLYHRFPAGKDDMVKAVVSHVDSQIHEYIIGPLSNTNKSLDQRFTDMIDTIKKFYGNGRKNCLLNVLSLEGTNPEIKSLMNETYNAWLVALTYLAKEAGAGQQDAETKSARFLIVLEGALVIQRLTSKAQILQKSLEYEQKQFFM